MTVKTIAGSDRWGVKSRSDDEDAGRKDCLPGRAVHSVFLAGNGLSIADAILGFHIAELLDQEKWLVALIEGGVAFIASALMAGWLAQTYEETKEKARKKVEEKKGQAEKEAEKNGKDKQNKRRRTRTS